MLEIKTNDWPVAKSNSVHLCFSLSPCGRHLELSILSRKRRLQEARELLRFDHVLVTRPIESIEPEVRGVIETAYVKFHHLVIARFVLCSFL